MRVEESGFRPVGVLERVELDAPENEPSLGGIAAAEAPDIRPLT